MAANNKSRKPWPTQKAMAQVYERGLWGSNGSPFYSGGGSHDKEMVQPYVDVVSEFLKSFETPLSVCDLGCGDFNVGRQLVTYTKSYIGVDIVPDLIAFNQKSFKDDRLEFKCLDIAKDDLPQADCVMLRQVLQHLSNAEIQKITEKLNDYRYVLLTEHLPTGDFIPNKDIISGQGIRLKHQSGVNLLNLPFHLKIKSKKELLCLDYPKFGGCLVTTLFKMY